jgi:hypothetical protein
MQKNADTADHALRAAPRLLDPAALGSTINSIDAGALGSIEAIERERREAGCALHLCEVKGPLTTGLQVKEFMHDLRNAAGTTHDQAIVASTFKLPTRLGRGLSESATAPQESLGAR